MPAARVPRLAHKLSVEDGGANGQIRNVNEDFDVAGEQLAYPRDPKGSPENTINCHCVMKPFFEADALKSTPGQRGLLQDLGIEISVGPA